MKTRSHEIVLENWCMVFKTNSVSPVTISIPHDGLITADLSGFFESRRVGYRGRDKYVWPVAKDIIQMYPANAVRGLLPRDLVDYNRAWPIGINYHPLTQKDVHTALDDKRLVSPYQYYHSVLENITKESIGKFGKEKVLLIDLHGFAKQPPYAPVDGFDLILGTGNRVTVPYGETDIHFAEFMRGRGYRVFLPLSLAIGAEEDYYSADFTTRHHSERLGINVLQIEIASRFRSREGFEIGKKLSEDLAEFLIKSY